MEQVNTDRSLLFLILGVVRSYFLLLIPLGVITRGLYRKIASPLRSTPGPFLASCTRVWKTWKVYQGNLELERIALHDQYGPVVRIAPDEVSFGSPAAARDILTVGKGFHKTDFYSVFPPKANPDIFTEVREWKHAQMKRFAVTPYSLASMQKHVGQIEVVERDFMVKLDDFAKSGQICDLGHWLHWFAFDVLGEVAFSRRFGFLATASDVQGSIKSIDNIQWYDGIVGQIPWTDRLFRNNPLVHYLPFLQLKPTVMTMYALEELDKRKAHSDFERGQEDLMGQLLKVHAANPEKFSEGDVFAIAHGAIFAGSDSTASTMQSFFYYILNSPAILSKLRAELDQAQQSNNLSPMISYAEAQRLSYFQACLKEAMRLRPAVGLDMVRHVPPSGATIDGTFYAGGTRVALNSWVLHRDKATFGHDVDTFRPERWFEANAKEMERNMYQFGGGSHLCIGRNLALLEMGKILPQLLREYDIELVYPGRPLKSHTTFFVMQEGLEVRLKKQRV